MDRAQGAYLFDRQGRPIFDAIASWWVITHGHCHPALVAAIQKQAARVDQVLFANFSHSPAEELAEELVRLTPPSLSRVFFTDNGSTAVEAALKMALQAASQSGSPQKTQFVAFANGYHGDTVGAMSVSGESLFTKPYRPTLFQVQRAVSAADLERILDQSKGTIAGVIIEPLLQAAGGMIVWPKEELQKIARLCQDRGVYLIFDEVMTGFGRTGSLFAFEQLDVVPDLLCLSKGISGGTLPLAVTLASEVIYQAFIAEEKSKMFFHGHSFTGNPIACAAAVANIQLFASENTLAQIARIGERNRQRLGRLANHRFVANPRYIGTMAAFELETTDGGGYQSRLAEEIMQRALKRGVFLRPLGNTVYVLPPYCSKNEDLDQMWDGIEYAVSDLHLPLAT